MNKIKSRDGSREIIWHFHSARYKKLENHTHARVCARVCVFSGVETALKAYNGSSLAFIAFGLLRSSQLQSKNE